MADVERKDDARLTRRAALGALAAGAGALVLGVPESAVADDEAEAAHWISWDDGWEYPLVGTDAGGERFAADGLSAAD